MSRPATERHVVPCDGPEQGPIRDALGVVAGLLKLHADVRSVTLAIPSLDNLDERTTLGEVLGKPLAKQLKKNREVAFNKTCVLQLRTLRDVRRSGPIEAVLAVYFDSDMLDEIDALPTVRFVVVVPWTNAGVERWIRTWNPNVFGGQGAPEESPLVSNPVVAIALARLTKMVNLSTGISHPSDRDATEALLWHLRKAGEWAAPEEMRLWLVRNGWKPGDADAVMAIAKKTALRRSAPKSATRYFAKDSIERFRSEADIGAARGKPRS